ALRHRPWVHPRNVSGVRSGGGRPGAAVVSGCAPCARSGETARPPARPGFEAATYSFATAFFSAARPSGTLVSLMERDPNDAAAFPFAATTTVTFAFVFTPQPSGPALSPGKTVSAVFWRLIDCWARGRYSFVCCLSSVSQTATAAAWALSSGSTPS